jgi:hypothetical protein
MRLCFLCSYLPEIAKRNTVWQRDVRRKKPESRTSRTTGKIRHHRDKVVSFTVYAYCPYTPIFCTASWSKKEPEMRGKTFRGMKREGRTRAQRARKRNIAPIFFWPCCAPIRLSRIYSVLLLGAKTNSKREEKASRKKERPDLRTKDENTKLRNAGVLALL